MSYDVTIRLEDGTEAEWLNYTSNAYEMFKLALDKGFGRGTIGLRELDGKPCNQAIEPLGAAVAYWLNNRKKFEALNSPNGWGREVTALPFMLELLVACINNPNGRIEVDA